jgi:hypothetical protein
MKISLLSILLYGFAITIPANYCMTGKVEKNNMLVRWKVQETTILMEVSAPTNGWVAIGFNTKEGLSGTNLIMACVKDGKVVVEDYYTKKPGDYKPILQLGGQNGISNIDGEEQTAFTKVTFELALNLKDGFHHTLKKDGEYYLLMAYSQSDNFQHHSIMRTSEKIKL